MTDPFNDHTSDPATPPTSESPIEAAVAAAADAPSPVVHASRRPQPPTRPEGPVVRRAGPARRRAARRRRDGLHRTRCPCRPRRFPLIRDGRDLMVQSRTGSGKTAAFGIPFANGIVNGEDKFVQAIVLLPTRELALQVAAELAQDLRSTGEITVVPVYGGAPMGRQVEQLRAGGQIVCGTPGRVLDHLRRGTLKLDRRALRRARRVRRDAVDGLPGGHRIHPGEDARPRGRRCCSRRRCPRGSSGWRGGSCARPSS